MESEATTAASRISVGGVVQGVGFRPFVYNLALRLGLKGWVLNHSGGVDVEIEGPQQALDQFEIALRAEAPPLAHVESVSVERVPPRGYHAFEIRHSERQEGRYQLISPDVATCPDCRRELFDEGDRRFRYPFTNCTNCGPRFTIIADIPYDRPNTTMRVFPMCPECQREYDDPTNRRFHAQPNACPVCGPHVWLAGADGTPLAGDEQHADPATLQQVRERLLAGEIVAIKGLGGFQLACDATNAEAVRKLRARKRRPHKPFAIMTASLEQARALCRLSPAEEALLASPQAPIVLVPRREGLHVAEEVAPGSRVLGVMLPYTPLHHVLLLDVGRPLVMTSGNLSEEPIARDNDEAVRRLGQATGIADAFLLHNRDIYARYDDSVWQVMRVGSGRPQPARRARGYAPFPIRLPFPVAPTLAVGPDLKNTFCLARDEYAFVSQHIGDMENLDTLEHFEATLALYRHLFRLEAEQIVCDAHPDYQTARWALAEYPANDVLRVQHHRAHIAACLADNGRTAADGPVIGVALDGTGYGDDGAIWGGEWLVGDYRGLRRAAHLEYLPLPGGDAAIHHPWRVAAAYVYTLFGAAAVPEELLVHGLASGENAGSLRTASPADSERVASVLYRQIERRINTVPTSSMGRLFDAVSALLGVCRSASYEAQAAIELEQVALRAESRAHAALWRPGEAGSAGAQPGDVFGSGNESRPAVTAHPFNPFPKSVDTDSRSSKPKDVIGASTVQWAAYPFELQEVDGVWQVRLRRLVAAIMAERQAGRPAGESAWRFHWTIARLIEEVCCRLRGQTGIETVALSGGCFQNRLLVELAVPLLEQAGFTILLHRQVPCNDGGVSLGQAVLAHF